MTDLEREWYGEGPLRNAADEEMANADRELERMGFEALDRCLEKGADPEDLKTVARLAGLSWQPENTNAAHR